jgi:phosphoglycolate phosphatase-like HAD superfamily hydrolase
MHLIMFDIDGTLVDSAALDADLYCAAVRDVLGVEVDRTWASYAHVTDSGILDELIRASGSRRPEHDASLVERAFVDSVRNRLEGEASGVREVRGARRLVTELLKCRSACVAIATGGWRETALLKLRHVGIDPDALTVATASDARERTRIMQIAEQRARRSVAYSRRTYFGDAAWDLRASGDLGYDFVAVGDGIEHAPRYVDLSDSAAILAHLGL